MLQPQHHLFYFFPFKYCLETFILYCVSFLCSLLLFQYPPKLSIPFYCWCFFSMFSILFVLTSPRSNERGEGSVKYMVLVSSFFF